MTKSRVKTRQTYCIQPNSGHPSQPMVSKVLAYDEFDRAVVIDVRLVQGGREF